MSKFRGGVAVLLATTFGIVNGVYVFQPMLASRQAEREQEAKNTLEAGQQTSQSEVNIIRNAEAAAAQSSASESPLKPTSSSSSWWPKLGFWSTTENAETNRSGGSPPLVESTPIPRGGKQEKT